jgi:hypothetical protein
VILQNLLQSALAGIQGCEHRDVPLDILPPSLFILGFVGGRALEFVLIGRSGFGMGCTLWHLLSDWSGRTGLAALTIAFVLRISLGVVIVLTTLAAALGFTIGAVALLLLVLESTATCFVVVVIRDLLLSVALFIVLLCRFFLLTTGGFLFRGIEVLEFLEGALLTGGSDKLVPSCVMSWINDVPQGSWRVRRSREEHEPHVFRLLHGFKMSRMRLGNIRFTHGRRRWQRQVMAFQFGSPSA